MDIQDVTFRELKNFKESFNYMKAEDQIELYLAWKEKSQEKEIIDKVLKLFPTFPGQELELNFIDPEKTMAVVSIYRNKSSANKDSIRELVSYFSYLNTYGVMGEYHDTYEKAVLGCICLKEKANITCTPLSLICKILDMNKKEKTEEKSKDELTEDNSTEKSPIEKIFIEQIPKEEIPNTEKGEF